MKIKKLYYFFITFILISAISISWCVLMRKIDTPSGLTIRDIAFDKNKKSGYTVYIEEDSEFAPYLVLTSNYNGNALLLRKDVMDKDYVYNEGSSDHYPSYYRDSFIDRFLNNDFLITLEPELQNAIVDSKIVITTESSYFSPEQYTESINRKVFLLSYTEVGLPELSFVSKEGKPLKYFKEYGSRIAYKNVDGISKKWIWWLRTPYLAYDDGQVAWVVGPQGIADGNAIEGFFPEEGVRPAFCLRNTVQIEENNKVIYGKTVYVITK